MPPCDFSEDSLIEIWHRLVSSDFNLSPEVNSLDSYSHPLKISFYWFKSQRAGVREKGIFLYPYSPFLAGLRIKLPCHRLTGENPLSFCTYSVP